MGIQVQVKWRPLGHMAYQEWPLLCDQQPRPCPPRF